MNRTRRARRTRKYKQRGGSLKFLSEVMATPYYSSYVEHKANSFPEITIYDEEINGINLKEIAIHIQYWFSGVENETDFIQRIEELRNDETFKNDAEPFIKKVEQSLRSDQSIRDIQLFDLLNKANYPLLIWPLITSKVDENKIRPVLA
jgi:hypothetical protein